MFKYTSEETSGRRVFKITWTAQPVGFDAYRALFAYFWKSTNYAPISAARRKTIQAETANINKRFKTKINMYQAMSIHHMVMKEKVIRGYGRMNTKIPIIAEQYNAGTDIVKLSEEHDFPPLNLLRGILLYNGFNAAVIRKLFSAKDDIDNLVKSTLTGRDVVQFKRALKNDADSVFDQQEVARMAQQNEDAFVDYFRKIGIRLRTQEQLAQIQTIQHGRPVITPDLLFLDVVYINGAQVNWVDYKAYFGSDVRFIYDSNLKQARRYAQHYGIGAVAYQMGFVDGLGLEGAIPLDCQCLADKIDFINDLYR